MITMTLSFRSAYRLGFPALAGQPVQLQERPDGQFTVFAGSRTLGTVAHPREIRQPGGVPPHKSRRRKAAKVIRDLEWPGKIRPLARDGHEGQSVHVANARENTAVRLGTRWGFDVWGVQFNPAGVAHKVSVVEVRVFARRRKGLRPIRVVEVALEVKRETATETGSYEPTWFPMTGTYAIVGYNQTLGVRVNTQTVPGFRPVEIEILLETSVGDSDESGGLRDRVRRFSREVF